MNEQELGKKLARFWEELDREKLETLHTDVLMHRLIAYFDNKDVTKALLDELDIIKQELETLTAAIRRNGIYIPNENGTTNEQTDGHPRREGYRLIGRNTSGAQ